MRIQIEVPDCYAGQEINIKTKLLENKEIARSLLAYSRKLCGENFELIRKKDSRYSTLRCQTICADAFNRTIALLRGMKRELFTYTFPRDIEDYVITMDDVDFIVETHARIANVMMHQAELYLSKNQY